MNLTKLQTTRIFLFEISRLFVASWHRRKKTMHFNMYKIAWYFTFQNSKNKGEFFPILCFIKQKLRVKMFPDGCGIIAYGYQLIPKNLYLSYFYMAFFKTEIKPVSFARNSEIETRMICVSFNSRVLKRGLILDIWNLIL